MTMTNELRNEVIERDAYYIFGHYPRPFSPLSYAQWLVQHPVICIVRTIDPLNPTRCGGKQEVDHVKDQPMMGKRAPDDAAHLVAMCQEHNTWHPPRKELRQAERRYLKQHATALPGA